MRFESPDLTQIIDHPTAAQIEAALRKTSFGDWQHGGSGEAILRADSGKTLSITQPEDGRFFVLLLKDWLVPYNGASCDSLVESEFGGNPFWIPRACLIGVTEAVAISTHFATQEGPWPGVNWHPWEHLPLPVDYPGER